MELNRIETQHNTEQQVAEYVEVAQRIADGAGIVRNAEPEVFVKILDMVAAKTLTVVQQPVGVGALPHLGVPRH